MCEGNSELITKTEAYWKEKQRILFLNTRSEADSILPVGEGAYPWGGGARYDFAYFPQNLHEIEKILGRRARGVPLLDPPL